MTSRVHVFGVRTPLRDPKASLAELQAYVRSQGGWAQILNADVVVGIDHVRSAVLHATRALERGSHSAGSIEIEFLLYASGERQISKAIERAGVRAGEPFVAVVVGGPGPAKVLSRFHWNRDDRLLDATLVKLRGLGFGAAEIEASGETARDLALERVARVDLLR